MPGGRADEEGSRSRQNEDIDEIRYHYKQVSFLARPRIPLRAALPQQPPHRNLFNEVTGVVLAISN